MLGRMKDTEEGPLDVVTQVSCLLGSRNTTSQVMCEGIGMGNGAGHVDSCPRL